MKKFLLITLLLIPFISFSQTTKPITGFLGIKFGSSKLAVINAVKARGGVIDKTCTNAQRVCFSYVKLGNRKSERFLVKFINGKAYSASFLFKADIDQHTIDYYNDVVNDVADAYGQGTPTKEFRSGFKDGDGHEVTAIENGYADFYTDWNSANNNSIEIQITTQLYIALSYYDGALQAEADAAQKAKNKSDY